MNNLRAFFESLAERWDDQQPPDRDQILRQLLAPFAAILEKANTILDVGTGTGMLIPRLQEVAPSAQLASIDLAHAMLERAQQRCPDALLVQADIHHLPFECFDLVICHNSFPHFSDPPAALVEIARILNPGGHLLILHDLSRERVNAIHSGGGEAIQHDLLPTGEDLSRMLADAGFTDIQVEDNDEHYVAVGLIY